MVALNSVSNFTSLTLQPLPLPHLELLGAPVVCAYLPDLTKGGHFNRNRLASLHSARTTHAL